MRYFQIENPTICEVTGQDAQRYLNARLTQNLKNQGIGCSSLAAALTPQGKTQALFYICRVEEQRYYLTSDHGDKEEIIAALKRYIVADRVTVINVSDQYSLYHVLPDAQENVFREFLSLAELPSKSNIVISFENGYVSMRNRGFGNGLEVLISQSGVEKFKAFLEERKAHAFSKGDIQFSRISGRIPAYPEEINEDTLFSEARFRSALSTNKGCFVGQEVVEKIESVGKTAYVLQVVECDGCKTFNVSDEVKAHDGAVIGKVLSSAWSPQDNKTICFVRVKNSRSLADASVTIGGDEGVLRWED